MKFKISPEVLRQVRRHLINASLARWMARAAADRGDVYLVRSYRLENSFELSRARLLVDREYFRQLEGRTRHTMEILSELFPERFKSEVRSANESASESVSESAASSGLPVRSVLGKFGPSRARKSPGFRIKLIIDQYDECHITLDRTRFPRLGKHWAPLSVLVGYQERKRHAICRA